MRSRPTRQGVIVTVAAVLAIVAGRLFGVIELYLLGAAMILAALTAWLVVAVRRPRVEVHRWIRPSVLTAGDVGRVEVLVEQIGRSRSPSFELIEPVGSTRTARMAVAPLGADAEVSAGYRIPTDRRGVLTIGPLTAVRYDALGLARSTSEVAGTEEVLVAPRAHLVDMPQLGQGVLGRHLLALAQRLGPGDFHSLPRLRRGRRAAVDPLAGIGTVRGAEGASGHRRGAAPLRGPARPARAVRRCGGRGVRTGGHRSGEHRAQRRSRRPHDTLRDDRRRRHPRAGRGRPDAAPPRPDRRSHRRPGPLVVPRRARSRRGARSRHHRHDATCLRDRHAAGARR